MPLRREKRGCFLRSQGSKILPSGDVLFLVFKIVAGLVQATPYEQGGDLAKRGGAQPPILGFWAGFCPVVLIFCLKPVTALVYAVRLWITLGLARARFSKSFKPFLFFPQRQPLLMLD